MTFEEYVEINIAKCREMVADRVEEMRINLADRGATEDEIAEAEKWLDGEIRKGVESTLAAGLRWLDEPDAPPALQ